jgi:hypothetical protein
MALFDFRAILPLYYYLLFSGGHLSSEALEVYNLILVSTGICYRQHHEHILTGS